MGGKQLTNLFTFMVLGIFFVTLKAAAARLEYAEFREVTMYNPLYASDRVSIMGWQVNENKRSFGVGARRN
jgi:hypothetical protein